MTPPITKAIMASRPLYDPDPNTFVPRDVVQQKTLRRVRLSDFAVITLQLNIQNGHLSKAAVDIFETVYVQGAKPRSARVHEGRPALAPDGSIMSMNGIGYPGGSGLPAGKWTTENVKDCPGYEEWLAQLVQTEGEMVARGFPVERKNEPMPNRADLAVANAYSHSRATKSQAASQRRGLTRNEGSAESKGGFQRNETAVTDNAIINIAADFINSAADTIVSFVDHVQSSIASPATQKELYKNMRNRIADIFPAEELRPLSDMQTSIARPLGSAATPEALLSKLASSQSEEVALSNDMEDALEASPGSPTTLSTTRRPQAATHTQSRTAGVMRSQHQSIVGDIGAANKAEQKRSGQNTNAVEASGGYVRIKAAGIGPHEDGKEGNAEGHLDKKGEVKANSDKEEEAEEDPYKEREAKEGSGEEEETEQDSGDKEETEEDSEEEEETEEDSDEEEDTEDDDSSEDSDVREWKREIKAAIDHLASLPPATAEELARAEIAHNLLAGGSPIDALRIGKNPFKRRRK